MRFKSLALPGLLAALLPVPDGAPRAQVPAPPGLASPAPTSSIRMQTVEIVDPNGFERPMVAATIRIPEGWQSTGGVVWQQRPACAIDATQFRFAAQDASGMFGVEMLPSMSWQANNLPIQMPAGVGCPTVAITGPQQFLQWLVPRVRPGARILDYRPRPDLIKVQPPQFPSMPGIEQRNSREGGEVLIAYEVQGRPMREVIQAITDVFITRMPGVMPGEVREFLSGTSFSAFAVRAPDGQLRFGAVEAIRSSFAVAPEWGARMQGHQTALAAAGAKGARDRSAIIAKNTAEVNDIINKGWAERQKVQEGIHERTIRAIRQEELYATPDGGQVVLPGIFGRAWQTDSGNYIVNPDGSLPADTRFGVNTTPLQRLD